MIKEEEVISINGEWVKKEDKNFELNYLRVKINLLESDIKRLSANNRKNMLLCGFLTMFATIAVYNLLMRLFT